MGVGLLPEGRCILIKNCEGGELLKSVVVQAPRLPAPPIASLRIGKPQKKKQGRRRGFSRLQRFSEIQRGRHRSKESRDCGREPAE